MARTDQKQEPVISYYEVLNVSPQSSDEEIKQAYKKMAMRHHPDKNPQSRQLSELRFKMINEAYAGLETREKRRAYNRKLRLHAENDNTAYGSSFLSQIVEIFWPAKTPSNRV